MTKTSRLSNNSVTPSMTSAAFHAALNTCSQCPAPSNNRLFFFNIVLNLFSRLSVSFLAICIAVSASPRLSNDTLPNG